MKKTRKKNRERKASKNNNRKKNSRPGFEGKKKEFINKLQHSSCVWSKMLKK